MSGDLIYVHEGTVAVRRVAGKRYVRLELDSGAVLLSPSDCRKLGLELVAVGREVDTEAALERMTTPSADSTVRRSPGGGRR